MRSLSFFSSVMSQVAKYGIPTMMSAIRKYALQDFRPAMRLRSKNSTGAGLKESRTQRSDGLSELRSQTGIRTRRELHQDRLVVRRDVQGLQEHPHGLRRDLLAPGELLELLVRVRHAVLAHDRLHGLAEQRPLRRELLRNRIRVDGGAAQAALRGPHSEKAVREAHAEAAEHGAVAQVALQPADRELRREVAEQGVGHPRVAFGILEVDRVHLVGHRRGTDLARDDLQLEQPAAHVRS